MEGRKKTTDKNKKNLIMTFKHLTPFLCPIFENVSVDIRNCVTVSLTKQTRKTKETNQRKYKEIPILLKLEEPCYAGETIYN
jgi:hypothetical protein